MFALNLGYKWNLASAVSAVENVLFLPQGNSRFRLEPAPRLEARSVLFDPQLYLSGLNAETCGRVCVRLASYPWFAVEGLPQFVPGGITPTQWEAASRPVISGCWSRLLPTDEDAIRSACLRAVEFQLALGTAAVILPSPLVVEREDDGDTQAAWLDAGINATSALEVGQPVLATVAVSEEVLNEAAFEPAGFLDTLVDQVTSRADLEGVYLVVAQTGDGHPFEMSDRVFRAYLHLTRAFASQTYDLVLVNFADLASFPCIGLGATGFATGQSFPLRRLSLAGFNDDGFGRALPYFYSHRAAAEFLSETHLDPIVRARLLGRVRDNTIYGAPLMSELGRGGSAANLRAWAESQNNVGEAAKHFLSRLATETRDLLSVPPSDRVDPVRTWLEEAAANRLYLDARLRDVAPGPHGRFAPSESWLSVLDTFIP